MQKRTKMHDKFENSCNKRAKIHFQFQNSYKKGKKLQKKTKMQKRAHKIFKFEKYICKKGRK